MNADKRGSEIATGNRDELNNKRARQNNSSHGTTFFGLIVIRFRIRGYLRLSAADLVLQPAADGGVFNHDRLRAFGAGGDQANLHAYFLRKKFDIAAGVCGKGTHFSRSYG
jgi:hypothetical protein